MEEAGELHQSDTQKIIRMMQENSRDPIPSLQGMDALKVESIVSEVNDIICNIRVESLDCLQKKFKEPYWKKRIEDDIVRLRFEANRGFA